MFSFPKKSCFNLFQMRYYSVYFILLFSALLFSFSKEISKPSLNKQVPPFITTLRKFPIIDSSFRLNSLCISSQPNYRRIDTENDFGFFQDLQSMPIAFGMLPDTSKYYIFLYGQAAACYMPYIAVFSKSGKMMDSKEVHYGSGSGCGFHWSSLIKLTDSNAIKSTYYEKRYTCDSLSKPVVGSEQTIQIIYSYMISKNGKILDRIDTLDNSKKSKK
jgi:hypothetical protein